MVTPTIKYKGTVVSVMLHIFLVIPTIKYKGTNDLSCYIYL